jgi:predicted negative regulator of RcsB-dependent stress response
MANHLDLEEQEQLDQLKNFWKQYGNLISWALISVMGAFASWNFFQYYQRSQATQAAAMFDEVERVIKSADAAKIDRVFVDMKDRFASTTFAQQTGLLVAKHYYSVGNVDATVAALSWVSEKSTDPGYQAIAKLRLAGVMIESKSFDKALKLLNSSFPVSFEALVADRKGDIFLLQGNKNEAISEYQKTFSNLDKPTEYRRLVEFKLSSLGAAPKGALDLPATNSVALEGNK